MSNCKPKVPSIHEENGHIVSSHERKKPFKCEICNKTFSYKSTIKEHKATVHDGQKPYNCEFCEKKFSSKSNFKKHVVMVHAGKKPLECMFCNKMFSEKRKIDIIYHASNVN